LLVPSHLHLGINTCFAVKRWPEPEQWISIVTDDLGLQYCQFSLDQIDPLLDESATAAYAASVQKHAAESGLRIHSAFTGLAAYSWSQLLHPERAVRQAAVRWYRRAIDITAGLGAAGVGGHLGAFSVRDAADQARRHLLLDELAEYIGGLSTYADAQGLSFLLCENMAAPREYGHSIEEAHALLKLAPAGGVPLVLCYDVGHPCALKTGTRSDDYLAWLAEAWPHTPIIHLQQTDRSGDHHWPFTPAYNAVGMVDPDATLLALATWPADQDIYLFLEVIHPFEADDDAVLTDLRASVHYWREAMARAGLA
jgi:sugar phosphate isomerase/epimerase